MKKKNGFIAISLIYSFFLCFIMLMMGLLANYAHSKLILDKINEPLVFAQDNKLNNKVLNSVIDIKEEIPEYSNGSSATEAAIYKIEDDEGYIYYFRGAIKNNYVSFAGILWRVVRINGDGTIRLITNEDIGSSQFNTNSLHNMYVVGYTNDNEKFCTLLNPCTDEGNTSEIKDYLSSWYDQNLKDYDDKIEFGLFCNDTSTSSGDVEELNYGSQIRTGENKPSLQCPDTDKDYGGVYKLKIGLLSADEVMMAGFAANLSDNSADQTNFLYYDKSWWTFSPERSTSITSYTYTVNNGRLYDEDVENENAVRPVINLKADVKILQGDGTKDNPYLINTTN